MSLLNLQLSNLYEIYNRLHKLYLSNKDVIDIKKYFDSDTGRVAIFFELSNKSYNKWFNYDISNFTELSDSYKVYDDIRNKINFEIYKLNRM